MLPFLTVEEVKLPVGNSLSASQTDGFSITTGSTSPLNFLQEANKQTIQILKKSCLARGAIFMKRIFTPK
ncbi:hypothetical protein GCM10011425_13450 [Mucilaginibacter galii]|uniref:Uncharacterized protein n=1 Tax=Mucilaginibacter galii TaxID=2005073 RepID=A0A917N0S9_9SPHI|nr:hypothetical protein GCM10011425_13450 [Mucilaginibacter galii]